MLAFIEAGFFPCLREPVGCPATECGPDGAAGGYNFTGLKPDLFLKWRGGGSPVINDLWLTHLGYMLQK